MSEHKTTNKGNRTKNTGKEINLETSKQMGRSAKERFRKQKGIMGRSDPGANVRRQRQMVVAILDTTPSPEHEKKKTEK